MISGVIDLIFLDMMKVSKVKLRKTINKTGDKFYWKFDFYPPIGDENNKKVRFKSTGIYTYVKPQNKEQRSYNKEVISRLEILKHHTQNELLNHAFGARRSSSGSFSEYFKRLAETKNQSKSSKTIWLLVYKAFIRFNPEIKFKDLNPDISNSFQKFLLNLPHGNRPGIISMNSASVYYSKYLSALKQAYRDNLIDEDIAVKSKPIKKCLSKREFLSIDELRMLYQTPCRNREFKSVCLFMAHTGMRVSDVENLKYSDLVNSPSLGLHIRFKQKKTGLQQTLPLSDEAIALMPEKKGDCPYVFPNFKRNYKLLQKWIACAGLKKHVGFHTFRHTFATLLINSGIDIYTVQQVLGHRKIDTTMQYLNLFDVKKVDAINSIKIMQSQQP